VTSVRSKIQKIIDDRTGAQDLLDALVHEHASQLATAVNNNGLKAQLEFLADQRGVDPAEVLQHLEEGTQA